MWRNARFAAAYGLIAVALCQFAYFNAVERLSVAVALLLEYLAPVLIVGYLWVRGARPGRLTLLGWCSPWPACCWCSTCSAAPG